MNELKTVENKDIIFNEGLMKTMLEFASVMAKGVATVPKHLQGNQSDCLAVIMQAGRWGMDPYIVASKTHLVNGAMGYEAQLVSAVISSSTAIEGRFHYEYSEGWERLAGKCSLKKVKKAGRNGDYEVEVPVKGWTDKEEHGLWVRCGATLKGETEITWGMPVYMSSVLIRNSPLWVTDPTQQISYLSVKKWSRVNTPAVILGVYTSDELPESQSERDITPKAKVSALAGIVSQDKSIIEPESQDESLEVDTEVLIEEDRQIDLQNVLDIINQANSNTMLNDAAVFADEHVKAYPDDRVVMEKAYLKQKAKFNPPPEDKKAS